MPLQAVILLLQPIGAEGLGNTPKRMEDEIRLGGGVKIVQIRGQTVRYDDGVLLQSGHDIAEF